MGLLGRTVATELTESSRAIERTFAGSKISGVVVVEASVVPGGLKTSTDVFQIGVHVQRLGCLVLNKQRAIPLVNASYSTHDPYIQSIPPGAGVLGRLSNGLIG